MCSFFKDWECIFYIYKKEILALAAVGKVNDSGIWAMLMRGGVGNLDFVCLLLCKALCQGFAPYLFVSLPGLDGKLHHQGLMFYFPCLRHSPDGFWRWSISFWSFFLAPVGLVATLITSCHFSNLCARLDCSCLLISLLLPANPKFHLKKRNHGQLEGPHRPVPLLQSKLKGLCESLLCLYNMQQIGFCVGNMMTSLAETWGC